MDSARFKAITRNYSGLRIAVVGDFCLDRYLEIDPARAEISIETGLTVHNVTNVRSQPGGAGTVLNNLAAIGVGRIFPIGFCGLDGEGYELQRALSRVANVSMQYFFATPKRRTFTYAKPLVVARGKAPRELNRLDFKNWSVTPVSVQRQLAQSVKSIAGKFDAIIVLDQCDLPNTGVVGGAVLKALREVARKHPKVFIIADSRRGVRNFPPLAYKMNAAELATYVRSRRRVAISETRRIAQAVASKTGRSVFVTMAQDGILGANPEGQVEFAPALPVRGEIDIVGAGDAVTANLAAATAAGAGLRESLEIANAAASVVIHQLGTTGTANVKQIAALLRP